MIFLVVIIICLFVIIMCMSSTRRENFKRLDAGGKKHGKKLSTPNYKKHRRVGGCPGC